MINFKINLSNLDRTLRFIAGSGIISLAILYFQATLQYILIIMGAGLIFNAIIGFCGIYYYFGISTCPVTTKPKKKK